MDAEAVAALGMKKPDEEKLLEGIARIRMILDADDEDYDPTYKKAYQPRNEMPDQRIYACRLRRIPRKGGTPIIVELAVPGIVPLRPLHERLPALLSP